MDGRGGEGGGQFGLINCFVSRQEGVEEGQSLKPLNSLIFSGRTNKEYHASTISQRAATFVLYVRDVCCASQSFKPGQVDLKHCSVLKA